MTKPIFYYFPVRGRAEVIRLVCAEAGIDYAEHLIAKGTPPSNGKPTDFTELKATGLLPFAAAPVWEDADGFRLAQSHAIAVYLAKQHNLYGKDVRENARCDEAMLGVEDLRNEIRKLPAAPAEAKAAVRAELSDTVIPRWLGFFDKLLAANRGGDGFLVGDRLSVADLTLWYTMELILDNGLGAGLEKLPKLRAFYDRVAKQPRIAAYLASPKRYPLQKFA